MPSKGGNAKSNSKNREDWVKYDFASVQLDAAQKKDFKARWAAKPTEFLDHLGSYAQNGYKFSCSWDGANNCFIASMTCNEAGDPNFHFVLTSRSPDFWEALALNIYKTRECCDKEIWSDGSQEMGWG